MKIISVDERTVPLTSDTSNAGISFSSMTASAVVIEIETTAGRFKGLGFSSYGRYGHGGLLKERFIPRLLEAHPRDFEDEVTQGFSMARFWETLMNNEKEGGHGERSGAVGVLETAMWDAWAKSEDLPLWALLEKNIGHVNDNGTPPGQTIVYASGGHYRESMANTNQLADEARISLDAGFAWFKLKVGGETTASDIERIESVITATGNSQLVAIDANCAFGNQKFDEHFLEIDKLNLRWIEEPVNPLDYEALSNVVDLVQTPIATGENLFALADVMNLLRYGGLKPKRDSLQMDIILSYGLTEYFGMIKFAKARGWSQRDFIPHAGHQLALHVSAGLGLGAHEIANAQDNPFYGVSFDTKIQNGIAILSDNPGIGIEYKPSIFQYFDGMLD